MILNIEHMRYIPFLFSVLLLIGCTNSHLSTKITRFFQGTTGDFRPFSGEFEAEYVQMIDVNHTYIKIIDTNVTYQAYSLELNQSFEGELDRQTFVPLQSQNIDFEKNRVFLLGTFAYSGNGYKEEISLQSKSEATLKITVIPHPSGLAEPAGFFTLFAYQVDREIHSIKISKTTTIDLNDTRYYSPKMPI